jgi:hypothetical protein
MPYLQADNHIEDHGGHVHATYSAEEQSNITSLINGYSQILSELCNGCAVSAQARGQYDSWSMMVRHPGPLFCMGSTFCLWAGLANEFGPVYYPANSVDTTTPSNVTGGKGKGFVWSNGQMLSNLNISSGSHATFQRMRASSIVEWARLH